MSQQNDVMKYFREDLHRRLLSTDFKKQVDGIEMLQKVLLMYIQGSLNMEPECALFDLIIVGVSGSSIHGKGGN